MADLQPVPSLCRYLDLTNPKLTLIVGDIRDKEQCHLAMEDVSYVFHLAGRMVSSRAKGTCGGVSASPIHIVALCPMWEVCTLLCHPYGFLWPNNLLQNAALSCRHLA